MTMEFFENASVVQEGVERPIYLPVAQVAAVRTHQQRQRIPIQSGDDVEEIPVIKGPYRGDGQSERALSFRPISY